MLKLFHFDSIGILTSSVVGFIGIIVSLFCSRYLSGSSVKGKFYLRLGLLITSVICLVFADYLLLFLACWGLANFILSDLIRYKQNWIASRNSSNLAKKNFALGFLFLSVSFAILYFQFKTTSIQALIQNHSTDPSLFMAMFFLMGAGLIQSAIWPFQSWLISSVNAPTPVSALMHAGLVNGGGFLLVRFSPLLLQTPQIMHLLFVVGLLTAILGSLWKLVQSDIKSMLACSTISQMGFMILQCGLGLFPCAIAHLVCHGLFKSHAFLSAADVVRQKRNPSHRINQPLDFAMALFFGICGSLVFSYFWLGGLKLMTTSIFSIVISAILITQILLPIIKLDHKAKWIIAPFVTIAIGWLSALIIGKIDLFLDPLAKEHTLKMNPMHWFGLAAMLIAWLIMVFFPFLQKKASFERQWKRLYVRLLNGSQPAPQTVSSARNDYQF